MANNCVMDSVNLTYGNQIMPVLIGFTSPVNVLSNDSNSEEDSLLYDDMEQISYCALEKGTYSVKQEKSVYNSQGRLIGTDPKNRIDDKKRV